jgi:hypothetical protein
MAIYYTVRNSDDEIMKRQDYPVGFDPADVAHKFGPSHTYRIVPEVIIVPTYDVDTQYLGDRVYNVFVDRVEFTREVLQIPQAQLDDEADLEQVKAVLTDLRDGVGNAAQRITRLERVVFRLAKDAWF